MAVLNFEHDIIPKNDRQDLAQSMSYVNLQWKSLSNLHHMCITMFGNQHQRQLTVANKYIHEHNNILVSLLSNLNSPQVCHHIYSN